MATLPATLPAPPRDGDGLSYRWDRPDVPHKGWSCLGVDDHGEPTHRCEMCRFPAVRYVHTMAHPGYPGRLAVGCVCAGRMEDDYRRARARERAARNRSARRERVTARHERAALRWPVAGWRRSAKGNLWRRVGGVRVVVFPNQYRPGEWKAAVGERIGRLSYPTAEAAMGRVFDHLFPLSAYLADFDRHGRSTLKLPGERGFR